MRWNSKAICSSVAPMPCMTSIVDRWVSSAPRAARTTAADVAAAINRTSATASQRRARSDTSRGWTVARSAMNRAPGTSAAEQSAKTAGIGIRRQLEVDERRDRQVVAQTAGPEPFLQRRAHLAFGNRLSTGHARHRSRSAQRGFELTCASIRQLEYVAVLDCAGDHACGIGQRQARRRDDHHREGHDRDHIGRWSAQRPARKQAPLGLRARKEKARSSHLRRRQAADCAGFPSDRSASPSPAGSAALPACGRSARRRGSRPRWSCRAGSAR